MRPKRRVGVIRTDFFLDQDERRVLDELKELTSARSYAEVLRHMLHSAARANGIIPPRKIIETQAALTDWNLMGNKPDAKHKGTK